MDYISDLHEPRTNAEQSETSADLRGSFVSEKERRFQKARRGEPGTAGEHLYFIRVKGGPVKIGRSANVKVRLSMLQTACPFELVLLGVVDGAGTFEGTFHACLEAHHLRGEWFEWNPLVEQAIAAALGDGKWRTVFGLEEPFDWTTEDWRIGSPLYAGNPKYPQYQIAQTLSGGGK